MISPTLARCEWSSSLHCHYRACGESALSMDGRRRGNPASLLFIDSQCPGNLPALAALPFLLDRHPLLTCVPRLARQSSVCAPEPLSTHLCERRFHQSQAITILENSSQILNILKIESYEQTCMQLRLSEWFAAVATYLRTFSFESWPSWPSMLLAVSDLFVCPLCFINYRIIIMVRQLIPLCRTVEALVSWWPALIISRLGVRVFCDVVCKSTATWRVSTNLVLVCLCLLSTGRSC